MQMQTVENITRDVTQKKLNITICKYGIKKSLIFFNIQKKKKLYINLGNRYSHSQKSKMIIEIHKCG